MINIRGNAREILSLTLKHIDRVKVMRAKMGVFSTKYLFYRLFMKDFYIK